MGRLHFLLIIVLCTFIPDTGSAQWAGAFARMGFGARGVGMGNALVADASGQTSPYYNPALAPFAPTQQVAASYGVLSHDRELQYLQFMTPLEPYGGIAAGVIHAGVSNIDGRDNSGYHTRTYSTDEYAVFLAFGTEIANNVTAGIGLRVYHADLLDRLTVQNSFGLSGGLTLRLTEQLRWALSVDDLLAGYSWGGTSLDGAGGQDSFPLRIRTGGTYELLDGAARIAGEVEAQAVDAVTLRREVTETNGQPVLQPRAEAASETILVAHLGGEWYPVDQFGLRVGASNMSLGHPGRLVPGAGFVLVQEIGELSGRIEYAAQLENYLPSIWHLITVRLDL